MSKAIKRFTQNKSLFLFEFLDNIIEESEWFWSIYVFVMIGSLITPGIVGSLEAIGGSLVTLFVGKYADTYGKKLIPFAAMLLVLLTCFRLFAVQPLSAYVITVCAAFALTFFLVVYFSSVYKKVKKDDEEEFMVLREIPTVLGRLVVFAGIYVTLYNPRFFFVLPLITIILLIFLYFLKGKKTFQNEILETALSTE